ncbi:hypothetical protein WME79_24230 [Sorangium sp. So ce726]|uniref:hypothetical protein n=1 Tax=Sorangium sp. So ce726 TaxID=3133319 RepID=UPI003F60784B
MAVASLAAASFITLASASASAKGPEDWALEFIDNAVSNEWGTDPECFLNWDDEDPNIAWTGMTKGACFFTLSLQKAMGYTQQDISLMWGKRSPGSDYYYALVNASPAVGAIPTGIETYFRRVTRAIDIQKGDVFTIGAVGDCAAEMPTNCYPGHTMIITGAPEEIRPQIMPIYSGTKQYAVPIADSTGSNHGCTAGKYKDSRWSGACMGGKMEAGAGTGYVRVYTDSLTGILLGYTWSVTASTSSYYSPSTRPYRIGRLFKLPAPVPTDPPPPPE